MKDKCTFSWNAKTKDLDLTVEASSKLDFQFKAMSTLLIKKI